MEIEKIGEMALGSIVPVVIVFFIFAAHFKIKNRNIAHNCVGFLLIMLSIVMSGATNLYSAESIYHHTMYKFFAIIAGMFGTAICAIIAFKEQANK